MILMNFGDLRNLSLKFFETPKTMRIRFLYVQLRNFTNFYKNNFKSLQIYYLKCFVTVDLIINFHIGGVLE